MVPFEAAEQYGNKGRYPCKSFSVTSTFEGLLLPREKPSLLSSLRSVPTPRPRAFYFLSVDRLTSPLPREQLRDNPVGDHLVNYPRHRSTLPSATSLIPSSRRGVSDFNVVYRVYRDDD